MTKLVFISLLAACVKTAEVDSDVDDSSSPNTDILDSGGPLLDADDPEPDPIENIDSSTLPSGDSPCRQPVLGRVREITDGDTFKAETGRGVERVRMIGIDTPEVDHNGPDDECFGEEASDYLAALIDGDLVWLTFDSECDDQYDRTLAYVHTMAGFVQRSVLQAGMATAYRVLPNTSFSGLFDADESEARSAGIGMWGECP